MNRVPEIKDIIGKNGFGWLKEDKIKYFEDTLLSTGRRGVQEVIDFLRKSGFYDSPAAATYHSNYNGGLLDHSIIVYLVASKYYEVIKDMKPEIVEKMDENAIKISALLHDVCKICLYVPKEKYTKDANDMWVKYQGYEIKDTFPIGHGEKSVIMLQNFNLELTPDEMLAIRYHMGMWGGFNEGDALMSYKTAVQISPLVSLLQISDYTASQILEETVDLKAQAHR